MLDVVQVEVHLYLIQHLVHNDRPGAKQIVSAGNHF